MSEKGSIAIVAVIVVVLILLSAGGFFAYQILKTPPQTASNLPAIENTKPLSAAKPKTSSASASQAVPLKTEYQNPFEETYQDQNPFTVLSDTSSDNPFNNL